MCPAGMLRGVECRICNKNKNKKVKQTKLLDNLQQKPEYIWGTVYYVKIKNTNYYKIGISEKTVAYRLKEKYFEYIFEIPVESYSEAKGIENLILTIYENKLCVNVIENWNNPIPNSGGATEIFVEDVLGKNFDLDKFIYRIRRALFFYDKEKN